MHGSVVGLRSSALATWETSGTLTRPLLLRGAAERWVSARDGCGLRKRGADQTGCTPLAAPSMGTVEWSRLCPAAAGLEVADWCNCALETTGVDRLAMAEPALWEERLARPCRPPGRALRLASVAEGPAGLVNGIAIVCKMRGRRCRHAAVGSTAAAFSTSSLWRRLPASSGSLLVSCVAVVLTSVHRPGLRGSSAAPVSEPPSSALIRLAAPIVVVEVPTTARRLRQTAVHYGTTVYLRVPAVSNVIDVTVIVVTTEMTAA